MDDGGGSGAIGLSGTVEEIWRPQFIVSEFLEGLDLKEHRVDRDFNIRKLHEDLPEFLKRKGNEVLSDFILSHRYGERLCKVYREYCRSKIPVEGLLACGGSSIEHEEYGLFA